MTRAAAFFATILGPIAVAAVLTFSVTFAPIAAAQPSPQTGHERAAAARSIAQKLDSGSEEERAAMLASVIEAGLRLPEASVERLLRDPSPQIRKGMAAYPFLSDAQLGSLAARADARVARMLIEGRKEPAPPEVVQTLLASRNTEIDRVVAGAATVPLTPAQIALLTERRDLLVAFLLAQSRGAGSVETTLKALVDAGDPETIDDAIGRLPEVPTDVVDQLLAHAPLTVRRFLLMQGRFKPTPAQVARVLAEPDNELRIGLLRRKDIALPAESVAAGLFDADDNVAFFFRQRKEFAPTSVQIEAALTSPRPLLRRGFIGDERVPLTVAQIDRALADTDPIVRSQLIHRASVRLSDAQLDRCLADPDFSTRDGCARRADFHMTQPRFERLVQDTNPNLIGLFADARRPTAIDLSPFVTATLRSGSPAARMAVARNRSLALSETQMQIGLQADEADVRAAFVAAQRRRH